MKTQNEILSMTRSRQPRNKALALYIASITLVVVTYSLATAITVL
ncbi:hypothetical protein [Rasiella rasia]|nr:hypothetical protein [Rasiella rasia]